MSNEAQALFYGLALVAFAVAVIVSLIKEDGFKFSSFDFKALGLALWVFVPFLIVLRAS